MEWKRTEAKRPREMDATGVVVNWEWHLEPKAPRMSQFSNRAWRQPAGLPWGTKLREEELSFIPSAVSEMKSSNKGRVGGDARLCLHSSGLRRTLTEEIEEPSFIPSAVCEPRWALHMFDNKCREEDFELFQIAAVVTEEGGSSSYDQLVEAVLQCKAAGTR